MGGRGLLQVVFQENQVKGGAPELYLKMTGRS